MVYIAYTVAYPRAFAIQSYIRSNVFSLLCYQRIQAAVSHCSHLPTFYGVIIPFFIGGQLQKVQNKSEDNGRVANQYPYLFSTLANYMS